MTKVGLALVFGLAPSCLAVTGVVYHHRQFIARETRCNLQCGHEAFYRSCQLLGVPVRDVDLRALPNRPNGMSVNELSSALQRIGIANQVRLGNPFIGSGTGRPFIVKLNKPDHFAVFVQNDSSEVIMYDKLARPRRIAWTEILRRHSGIWIELKGAMREPIAGAYPRFGSLFIDCGEVELKSMARGTIDFQFDFLNSGDESLVIENVDVNCTCVKAIWPQGEIAPGEEGSLLLRYHPRVGDQDGEFIQDVLVRTNASELPYVHLQVSGRVTGKFAVIPRIDRLGLVRQGGTRTTTFFLDVPFGSSARSSHVDVRIRGSLPHGVACAVKRSKVTDYNAAMLASSPGFIPIKDRAGLHVYEVELACGVDASLGATVIQLDFIDQLTGDYCGSYWVEYVVVEGGG